ncbi:uncharacterized protein PV09_00024 [Verruconis gallopava]|uniref:F-box domain-containing protein n=1 Tax=Verruconis gallopava TaxID=253628 RepID=A0A0D1Y214_9PEZI|nr:uncharacterized protein PV09_00024 [Verruconis gallopava]KIW09076.1 hypothetical protein PV09_00024 [Verruconis gallopava]
MVVLLDLDDDPRLLDAADRSAYDHFKTQLRGPLLRAGNTQDALAHTDETAAVDADTANDQRPNPNLNGFSAILSCYPIVASLASHLDLNSLHDLSRTCRQFRANLLQHRKQLISQALRCSRENEAGGVKLANRLRESFFAWHGNYDYAPANRITSGKVGQCARDKVGECRRCGTIVCRNCIAKPPPLPLLRDRHRRLCKTCTRAPLASLTKRQLLPREDLYDDRFTPSSSPSSSPARSLRIPTPPVEPIEQKRAFTAPAFEYTPCSCPEEVWLCQPCGHSLRRADTDYKRGWTWRARYSTYLGVVGTGIGDGNEGVPCGRGGACLAAQVVEQEVDCDPGTLQHLEEEAEQTGRSWEGGGFEVQEMEGVGGVVKRKIKKLVLLGKRVQEHEDERSGNARYLSREENGEVRSWCAWCERVILSDNDKACI